MNIFVLDYDVERSAQYMCDKHVVKMMTEHNQMLSTAFRLMNGVKTKKLHKGKLKDFYVLDSKIENIVNKVTHINHPCNVWIRKSKQNYKWLYDYNIQTIKQYILRYGKQPKCIREGLMDILSDIPSNIPDKDLTPFPKAMPVEYDCGDVVQSYRKFYINDKREFARWSKTPVPDWWIL